MQKKTYLQHCLRNGKIVRWADNCMPLKVYIAPFRFYSKQGQDYKFLSMVIKAFEAWEKASAGKVAFMQVDNLLNSQINLDWKRVDRSALGHCYFNTDANNRLYSAEVQIGLSDGLIHQQYNTDDEVYHTILHEIGHSLGLGHSPYDSDIMYTPHKYGIVGLSAKDKMTLKWMYKFQTNMTPSEIASKYNVATNNIDEVVLKLIEKKHPSEFEKTKQSLKSSSKRDLMKEQENIADLKLYNLALQNVKIPENIIKQLVYKPQKPQIDK